MPNGQLNLGILGAGIGGLALAVLLKKAGHNVTVFERFKHVSEFGAGVQLSPNGVKVLRRLGIEHEILALASRPERIVMRQAENDRCIFRIQLGLSAATRYQAGFLQIHRSDLVRLLYEKAFKIGVTFRFGKEAFLESTNLKSAVISSNGQNFSFDAAVAADGVHSATRETFFQYGAPTFLNQVAYRATVPLDQIQNFWREPEVNILVAEGGHVVLYPLESRSLLNIIFCSDQKVWSSDGWSNTVDPQELVARFKNFIAIRNILNQIKVAHKWGLLGFENKRNWHLENLALLGDACHPMLPYLAQGANQALEDAAALSHFLSQQKSISISQAFELYGNKRRRRVLKVQKVSRRNASLYHLPNGVGRLVIHASLTLMSKVLPSFLLQQYDWLYDYEFPRE